MGDGWFAHLPRLGNIRRRSGPHVDGQRNDSADGASMGWRLDATGVGAACGDAWRRSRHAGIARPPGGLTPCQRCTNAIDALIVDFIAIFGGYRWVRLLQYRGYFGISTHLIKCNFTQCCAVIFLQVKLTELILRVRFMLPQICYATATPLQGKT